jgi:hypothetical protein
MNKIALPLLERIEIASPCAANWADMQGDDVKRFCSQCRLHVYDLSTMNQDDAVEFLQTNLERGGRTCVRLFRRSDGRVLTSDCPVGVGRLRLQIVKSAAAMLAFLVGGIAMAAGGTRLGKWAEQRQGVNAILGKVSPVTVLMGSVCVLPPAPVSVVPLPTTEAGTETALPLGESN